MVAATLLLALHPDGGMGHDRLETSMFWVGAMLAFMPVLVLLGVFGFVWWGRRTKRGHERDDPAPLELRGPDRPGAA